MIDEEYNEYSDSELEEDNIDDIETYLEENYVEDEINERYDNYDDEYETFEPMEEEDEEDNEEEGFLTELDKQVEEVIIKEEINISETNENLDENYLRNKNNYTFKTNKKIIEEINKFLKIKEIKEDIEYQLFYYPNEFLFYIWNNNLLTLINKDIVDLKKDYNFFKNIEKYEYEELKRFLFKDEEEFLFSFYNYLSSYYKIKQIEEIRQKIDNLKIEEIIELYKEIDIKEII